MQKRTIILLIFFQQYCFTCLSPIYPAVFVTAFILNSAKRERL
ncbi:hypothetical protein T09_2746 [Trichinella sp. T9]|nr:hypothetical protein T09_2746 [Trichinella sp. T9]